MESLLLVLQNQLPSPTFITQNPPCESSRFLAGVGSRRWYWECELLSVKEGQHFVALVRAIISCNKDMLLDP
ncbi:hypothetical protein OIU76_028730 [Salix suchowensis]|nr:hypothetical protein OIU76_028730 [Salix suchowensis]